MIYIDGFVLPVATDKRRDYTKYALIAAQVFKECGANRIVECWADDVPLGELTSFPRSVKCREDESVVFSWIEWPSRQSRDEGMQKFASDPRVQPDVWPMPVDGKRMILGGFEAIIDR